MLNAVTRWLRTLPYADPTTYRQASLLQTMLIVVAVLSLPSSFVTLLAPVPLTVALIVMGIIWTSLPLNIAGIALVRRGRFESGLAIGCFGLILVTGTLLLTTGVRTSGSSLLTFALPIVLAGLMGTGRLVIWTIVLSSISVAVTIALEEAGVPFVGIAASRAGNIGGDLGGFIVLTTILGIFTTAFGRTLRTALQEARERNQRLEELQATLETRIAGRTAELQSALAEVKERAATQERLLEENRQQRTIIQGLSVPVLPVSIDTLIVPLVGALDSERLHILQDQALHTLERSMARRLILDISGVPVVDQQVAQGLIDVVRQTRLLGAETVLVGVRPEVAQALVSIGVDLRQVHTYRDLEAALHDERPRTYTPRSDRR
ncbi:STAS domain-containing protein [Roseiflexus sp.]|uniref:STAS domain-containing protein n=1 Tax=Roseiflexus sp. TaxID=2562120 RepID=UPI00398B69EA